MTPQSMTPQSMTPQSMTPQLMTQESSRGEPTGQVLLAWSPPRADAHVDLTDAESDRVALMRRQVDRAGHVTARMLADTLLQHRDPALAVRSRVATVCGTCGSRAHGRPVIEVGAGRPGADLTGDDAEWHLSWAHSDHLVAVALSRQPVGVDTEPLARAGDLTDGIGELLPRLPGPGWRSSTPRARLRHWVATEAALKAAGLDLTRAHQLTTGSGPGSSSGVVRFHLQDKEFGVMLMEIDGQLVAVAAAHPPRIQLISLESARGR